jgi:hypothetical protein
MDKNKILLIIAPLLVLTALYFCVPALMIGRSALLASVNRAGNGFQPFPYKNELLQLLGEENAERKKFINIPWGDRNPFDTAKLKATAQKTSESVGSSAPPAEPDPVLMGILSGGERPSAIINDIAVGVGAKVGSLTVKEIKDGYVVLSNGVKEKTLKLKQ